MLVPPVTSDYLEVKEIADGSVHESCVITGPVDELYTNATEPPDVAAITTPFTTNLHGEPKTLPLARQPPELEGHMRYVPVRINNTVGNRRYRRSWPAQTPGCSPRKTCIVKTVALLIVTLPLKPIVMVFPTVSEFAGNVRLPIVVPPVRIELKAPFAGLEIAVLGDTSLPYNTTRLCYHAG